jgi:Flp pilus assembly protein TadG
MSEKAFRKTTKRRPDPAGPAPRGKVKGRSVIAAYLAGSSAGTVSVELALVTIFLATLTVGSFDMARFGIEKVRVTNAARAGVQYAIHANDAGLDKTAVEQAVRDDASDTTNELTITVGDPYCTCPGAGAVACSSTCADGLYAPEFMDVTVQGQIDFLFDYPGLPPSFPVAASSSMRLK